jgi:hypothetical protein
MALFWRIWTAVILVNLAVLTLLVGLATLQFDSINSGLVGERLAVLAGRTAAPFQSAAKIGLSLSAVRNADALLERARQTDDAILAIHVFDQAGRIVHSTAASAPAEIPPEALAARVAAAGASWHRETAGGFLSSIDIPARGGVTAGGIMIVYPGGGNVTQIRAMGAELGLAAIAVVLVAAALSALLLRIGLRHQLRDPPLRSQRMTEPANCDNFSMLPRRAIAQLGRLSPLLMRMDGDRPGRRPRARNRPRQPARQTDFNAGGNGHRLGAGCRLRRHLCLRPRC